MVRGSLLHHRPGGQKGDTSFLVLGDMQTDNTARLAAALNTIEASGIDYSFALQTGDAI